jgi:hypothetical protein
VLVMQWLALAIGLAKALPLTQSQGRQLGQRLLHFPQT